MTELSLACYAGVVFLNSPIGLARVDRLIREMNFDASQQVLDVGCGTGELLIRIVEAHGATGLGVDRDEGKMAEARAAASRRLPAGAVEFRTQNAAELDLRDRRYDRALCLGSTHAFGLGQGAYEHAIAALMRLVVSGGLILVGEPYWKQPPTPEYLSLLGEPVGIYRDHVENVLFAERKGLVPLYAAVSSDDEWDDFEWAHRRRHEENAAFGPKTAQAREDLEQSRRWRDGYLRWGRSTMGFGCYVFRNG
ncbi:MAG: class I SAM-dependent methyltransferase [Deltaproteobacteria bacterium]